MTRLDIENIESRNGFFPGSYAVCTFYNQHLRRDKCRTFRGWIGRFESACHQAFSAKGSAYRDRVIGGRGRFEVLVHLRNAQLWARKARGYLQEAERCRLR